MAVLTQPDQLATHILKATTTGEVSQLASWCFEPSQPQRITSGLNTNVILSPSYSFHKSSYHKSCLLCLFTFRGHSTQEPASGRVTYFILRAYTGTMSQPQPTQDKSGEVLEKMQVNGPKRQILARKKSIAVSVACMAMYRPTAGFKGRTFKLCVFHRWDFNFCVRSSQLRGVANNNKKNLKYSF